MQRNNTGFCKNLVKDHSTGVMTKAMDGDKKNSAEDVEAYMNGYPWPPRCYICGFCKREFKSAQALGGHMNVHRKDRARLRSSPPSDFISQYSTHGTILNLNLKPNPNPTFVSSPPPLPSSSSPFSSTVSTRQLTTSFSSVPSWISKPSLPPTSTFSPPSATENMERVVGGNLSGPSLNHKSSLDLSNQMKINAKSQEDGCMMSLDLEIGVLGGNSKHDIDLELRLGYSSY